MFTQLKDKAAELRESYFTTKESAERAELKLEEAMLALERQEIDSDSLN